MVHLSEKWGKRVVNLYEDRRASGLLLQFSEKVGILF